MIRSKILLTASSTFDTRRHIWNDNKSILNLPPNNIVCLCILRPRKLAKDNLVILLHNLLLVYVVLSQNAKNIRHGWL